MHSNGQRAPHAPPCAPPNRSTDFIPSPFFFLNAPVNSPLSQRGTSMGSRDFIYLFFLSSALMEGFHPVPPVLALALCVCVFSGSDPASQCELPWAAGGTSGAKGRFREGCGHCIHSCGTPVPTPLECCLELRWSRGSLLPAPEIHPIPSCPMPCFADRNTHDGDAEPRHGSQDTDTDSDDRQHPPRCDR